MKKRTRRRIEQDPTVQRFVEVASKFCELVDSGTRRRKVLIRQFVETLPELLHLALSLPTGRKSERIRKERTEIGRERNDRLRESIKRPISASIRKSPYWDSVIPVKEYFKKTRRLSEIFGEFDRYHEVFDPFRDREPIQASLACDLADIWHDLRGPLNLFQLNESAAKQHAVYDWSLSVRIHWGEYHAADALKALLNALRELDEDWEFWALGLHKKK